MTDWRCWQLLSTTKHSSRMIPRIPSRHDHANDHATTTSTIPRPRRPWHSTAAPTNIPLPKHPLLKKKDNRNFLFLSTPSWLLHQSIIHPKTTHGQLTRHVHPPNTRPLPPHPPKDIRVPVPRGTPISTPSSTQPVVAHFTARRRHRVDWRGEEGLGSSSRPRVLCLLVHIFCPFHQRELGPHHHHCRAEAHAPCTGWL